MIFDGLDLLQPIHEDRPCGENLEDTQLMASLDAFQLFGQPISLDPPPPWDEIRERALEALRRSKDLRALAHLAAALLRTEGLTGFFATLTIASRWLDQYWADVYPRIDDDAIMRRNALTALADQTAIVDALRRAVLVNSRQVGRFSLRDVEIASGAVSPGEDETPFDQRQIDAAFASVPLDDLTSVQQAVLAAIASVKTIDARMREGAAAPGLDPLLALLSRMESVIASHVAMHPGAAEAPGGGSVVSATAPAGGMSGIRSRQDAIRAMQAAAEFFRQNEPSSPVPMLLDRATRLVSKSFLEVLEDLVPEAVGSARAAGGIRNDE